MTDVYKKILALLDEKGVEYTTDHHAETRTSADSARIRGEALHTGAKALVMQGKKTKTHWLCVMPANLRFDRKKFEELTGERTSFARSPEEVTGCVPGSVPPLGSVVGLVTYCDPLLAENEVIHFNAGSLTDSVTMKYEDYIKVEDPILLDITEKQTEEIPVT